MPINRQNIIKIAQIGIIISAPLYLIRFTLRIPTTLHEIIILIACVIVLIFDWKSITKHFSEIPFLVRIGVGLVIIGALLGLVVSDNKMVTAGLIKGFIVTPMLGAFVATINLKQQKKQYLISSLVITGLYMAIYALVAGKIWEWDNFIRLVGLYSLDANASPNYLALFLTPILTGTIWVLCSSFKILNLLSRWFYSVSAVAMSIALVLTQSRAAVGIIGLLIVVQLYIQLKKRYKVLAVGMITIGMILFIAGTLYTALPNLSASPNEGRVATSNNIRYEIWKTTITELIPQNILFGVGLGNFQDTFDQITTGRVNYPEFITPRALTPHNIVLASWINIGIVGLIGLIIVIYQVLKNITFKSFWMWFILGILLLGVFDTPIFKNDLALLFWVGIFSASSIGDKETYELLS